MCDGFCERAEVFSCTGTFDDVVVASGSVEMATAWVSFNDSYWEIG
jgi:hypothetical protein